MTYDELLALINKAELGWFYGWMQDALRAVVELHKPSKIPDWVPTENEYICEGCAHTYPCPTIKAILEPAE